MAMLDEIMHTLRGDQAVVRPAAETGYTTSIRYDLHAQQWVVIYQRDGVPPYRGLTFASSDDVLAYFEATRMLDGWEVAEQPDTVLNQPNGA